MKQIRYIFVWLCLVMVLPLFAQQKQVRLVELYHKDGTSSFYKPSSIDSIKMNLYSVQPSVLLSNEGRSGGYTGVFAFDTPKVYDLEGTYIGFTSSLDSISAFPSYNVMQTEYDEVGQLLRASEVASGLFSDNDIQIYLGEDNNNYFFQVWLSLSDDVVLDLTNYSYTVMVSFPQGFLKDGFSGVESEAVISSFNGGAVEGAYWRVEQVKPVEPVGVLKEGGYVWLYDSALAEEQSGEQPNYPGYIGGEVSLRACTPEPFEGMDGVMYSVDYLLDGLISIVYDFPQENLYATPVASNADGTFSVLSGSLMASGLELTNGGTGSIGLFVCSLEGDQFYLENKNMVFNPDAESSGIYLYYPETETSHFVYFLIDEATNEMQGYMDMGTWVEFGEASNYQTSAAYGVRTPSALKRKLTLSDFKTDGLDRFPKQLPALKKFKSIRSVEGGTAPVRGIPIQEKPCGNELKVFRR